MNLLYQRVCFLCSLCHCQGGFPRHAIWEPEQGAQWWNQGNSMMSPPPGWWPVLGGQGLPLTSHLWHSHVTLPLSLAPFQPSTSHSLTTMPQLSEGYCMRICADGSGGQVEGWCVACDTALRGRLAVCTKRLTLGATIPSWSLV